MHYRGTLLNGEVFDESYGGDPAEFDLGRMIPGFAEGIQLMPVGSKYKFYMPQELAYGMQSRGRSDRARLDVDLRGRAVRDPRVAARKY